MRPTITETMECLNALLAQEVLPTLTTSRARAMAGMGLFCVQGLAAEWASALPNLMRDNDELAQALGGPAEMRGAYPDYAHEVAVSDALRAQAQAAIRVAREQPSADASAKRAAIRATLRASLERDRVYTAMPNERPAQERP